MTTNPAQESAEKNTNVVHKLKVQSCAGFGVGGASQKTTAQETWWLLEVPGLAFPGRTEQLLSGKSKENALEVVAGSHKGPLYNGSAFTTEDDTRPLYKERHLEAPGEE